MFYMKPFLSSHYCLEPMGLYPKQALMDLLKLLLAQDSCKLLKLMLRRISKR